ncbi:MAG: hypothetical protein ABI647_13465 [Gemmatimonadota bacterium]
MRKSLIVGLVIVAVLAVGGWYVYRRLMTAVAERPVPEHPFAKPSGPHAVGTREYFWTDSTRGEPYTKNPDDRRKIVVQVWYPAAPVPNAEPAHYLLRPDEFADPKAAKAAKDARTNSVLDAPLAASDSAYPVLVYNHGGSWTRWSATFSTEWLASQGYVVFSIEHFGFNQTVKYPDGSPFAADTLAFPTETEDKKKSALVSWAYLDDPIFKIWTADARYTLDRIEALNRDPGLFQRRLDLDRIGLFGWSFGGAVGVQMAADDPRVKAAVDHDGQLFGDVRQRGTKRPVMLIHHGVDDALDYPEKDRPTVHEMMALTEAWDSTARVSSSSDWFEVIVARTTHGDFSDLALFYPRPKDHLDPRLGHEIINAYTLAFFDRYLRGKGPNLLSSPPRFPDATFRAWPARKDGAAVKAVAKQ